MRDEELEREVKKAFDTPAFKDITVEVKNGVVRLTGTIPTGARRLEAAVAARAIPGVRAVEDDLRLATAKNNRHEALDSYAGGFYRREAVAEGRCPSVTRPGAAQPPEVTARAAASGQKRKTTMGGKIDQIKGRIKEAAGVLTDDDSLKNEGKLDQVVGEVKETAERVAEKVKETVAKAAEKVKDA